MSVEGGINGDRCACSGRSRIRQQDCYFPRFLHISQGVTDFQHGSSLSQLSRISLDKCPDVSVLGDSKPCNMTVNSTHFVQICLKRTASQENIFFFSVKSIQARVLFLHGNSSVNIWKVRRDLIGKSLRSSLDYSCQESCVQF